MNAPDEQSVTTIEAFKHFFIAPWFLAYGGVILAAAIGIIFFVAPRYGDKSMIWYILVCSLFGGLSVSCTQALGACVVTSIRGDNQVSLSHLYNGKSHLLKVQKLVYILPSGFCYLDPP